MPPKNVSAWRLNNAEKAEVQRRVSLGEDEHAVKRELQEKKAQANEDRKRAAGAIADAAAPKPAAKRAKTTTDGDPVSPPLPGDHSDPTNSAYYKEVQSDIRRILAQFPGMESASPLPLTNDAGTGVQEPFDKSKGEAALLTHEVYRCSIPVWWLSLLSSPTPGVPLSRKRTNDMAEFYYPDGKPSFMTSQTVEVQITNPGLSATPSSLQMVSPEEIVHALLAGCRRCIELLGSNFRRRVEVRWFLIVCDLSNYVYIIYIIS